MGVFGSLSDFFRGTKSALSSHGDLVLGASSRFLSPIDIWSSFTDIPFGRLRCLSQYIICSTWNFNTFDSAVTSGSRGRDSFREIDIQTGKPPSMSRMTLSNDDLGLAPSFYWRANTKVKYGNKKCGYSWQSSLRVCNATTCKPKSWFTPSSVGAILAGFFLMMYGFTVPFELRILFGKTRIHSGVLHLCSLLIARPPHGFFSWALNVVQG